MFRIAVITAPERLPQEAQALQIVGDMPEVYALHLRKPDYSEKELRQLIEALPAELRRKIRLHDHFELCEEYGLQGIHLNHRHPTPPAHIRSLSASCHNLGEVMDYKKTCDYVFLSPIFDSISKQGYTSNFSSETLSEAAQSGIIDHQVFALGGVTAAHIPLLKQWGFGGAALLGEIWKEYTTRPNLRALEEKIRRIVFLSERKEMMTLPALQFITHETEACSLVESAEKALSCGVKWVQFRCKTPQSAAWMREQALRVQQLCKQHHALFVVDDDVELAREIGADGVHLGKNDMPVEEARRILGARFLIGGTANTLQDMMRIQAQGGDYIGLGPFRFTRTKEKLSPVLGIEGYERLIRESRQAGVTIPVHAIGGITGQDAPALKQAGVQGIAVSSALLQSPAPQEEVARLLQPFLAL